ncbi:glyoxalase/bleomycin resistance protein/Dioxygenase superfamily protein [Bacillus sp. CN2]|nr:glyoxalase/bleomycin resistance protein/Dioxygenase superfamily protein [Bacillus sp. CN2]
MINTALSRKIQNRGKTMTAKRIDHTGIMVKDIETSIAFYQDVLGMQLKDRITHTNGIIELAFLGFQEGPETEIELIQGYSSELPAEGKVHHIALLTEDIAAEFTHAKRQGAVFIDEEITTLPNGYRYFYIEGPDGEWIEFFQR